MYRGAVSQIPGRAVFYWAVFTQRTVEDSRF